MTAKSLWATGLVRSICIVGCLLSTQTVTAMGQTRCVGESAPIHEKMAVLEEDSSCPGEITINRFRTLLARIARRCNQETSTSIADMIVTARRLLYEAGIQRGYLRITEDIDRITSGQSGLNCKETIALYVYLAERT